VRGAPKKKAKSKTGEGLPGEKARIKNQVKKSMYREYRKPKKTKTEERKGGREKKKKEIGGNNFLGKLKKKEFTPKTPRGEP